MSERSFPARSTVDTQPPIVYGGRRKEGVVAATISLRNHFAFILIQMDIGKLDAVNTLATGNHLPGVL